MNRLFLSIIGTMLASGPAFAEVCDKELGSGAPDWLMNASLWAYVGWSLISPVPLTMLAVAVLIAVQAPQLRWLALAMTLPMSLLASLFLYESLGQDPIVAAAYQEGCGNIYPASFMTYIIVAIAFLISFIIASKRRRQALQSINAR